MSENLADELARVVPNPRYWHLLEARIENNLTLEETGAELGGVSRERVRQLEGKAKRTISEKMHLLGAVLDSVENVFKHTRQSKGTDRDGTQRSRVVKQIEHSLAGSGYHTTQKDVTNLILLVRASVFLKLSPRKQSVAEKNWPRLTYFICWFNPPVLQHLKVSKEIRIEQYSKRRRSYKDLASQILRDSGEPLHWKILSEKVYRLGRRSSFSTAALYNAVQRHKDTFVRVGNGKYGLVEWGTNKVDNYVDIIAAIFKSEYKALSVEVVFSRVNIVREIKRQSLTMSLDMHPRFYKSIEGTYGLRVWLQPREQQTLRTPDWLVEDSLSYSRLEKAKQRGYHVEEIVESDRIEK